MFFVMIGVASALGDSFIEVDKVKVKKNSILTLNLKEEIKDYAPKSGEPFSEVFGFDERKLGLNEIINAIENAKYDNNILGISIEALQINAGIAQTQAIRKKLEEFKESGKFITAYADIYTQKNYYLSSVADSIYVNPVGQIDFKGLSGEILYFKDFQDKYGVKMEVVRHGKYKSAVEPFLTNSMSDANREQTESFLNSIWDELVKGIAINRNKTVDEINYIADELLARSPKLAVENKMVTRALFRDEYKKVLEMASDVNSEDAIYAISLKDYISTGKGRREYTAATDKIAVVYAQGEIIYGKGNENTIGQELMLETLEKVRKASNIKAVVFRINSPGGSALASDIIWRELELLKKEKPLVVSMGDVAASGGYYIACNANVIVAEPTTITGSIGVFGMLPNISTLADNLGINAEQVGTNKQSIDYSLFEPMSKSFYNLTEEGIENVYTTFLNRIVAGRGMTFEAVDSIAQGRVWSGTEALENGLVDQLGNLNDAISVAAELAEIESFSIRNYPSYEKDFKEMFQFPFAKSSNTILKEELGSEYFTLYNKFKALANINGVQARLPFLLEIN